MQLNTAHVLEENNELVHPTRASVQYPTWTLQYFEWIRIRQMGDELYIYKTYMAVKLEFWRHCLTNKDTR